MADEVIARKGASQFQPHPEGQFAMVCLDVINLGEAVVEYPDKPAYLTQKCALVWASGETNGDGSLITVSKEYTVSTDERANLRQHMEAWRGKSYTDAQLDEGLPIHKLVGQPCLMTVEQKKSGKGRIYANVKSLMTLPPAMRNAAQTDHFADLLANYKRGDYWQKRKDEYAAEVARFKSQHAAPDDPPSQETEDDNVPF